MQPIKLKIPYLKLSKDIVVYTYIIPTSTKILAESTAMTSSLH
jgi:hypothetical protein